MNKGRMVDSSPRPERTRVCRRCGGFHPEGDFPKGGQGGWVCAACVDQPSPMPLVVYLGREQYDTREVFAGLKTVWVQEGDERFQREQEVLCRLGRFYAAGENCIAFRGRATQTGRRLERLFPTARFSNWSDDGEFIMRFPVSLFPEVAEAVGVRKRRKLTPEQRERAARNFALAREASRKAREASAKGQ